MKKREPKLCKDVKPSGNPLDAKTSLAIMLKPLTNDGSFAYHLVKKTHLHISLPCQTTFSNPISFQRKFPLSIQSPTQILRFQQQEKKHPSAVRVSIRVEVM